MKKSLFNKAAFCAALFISTISVFSASATELKLSKSETYKDIIEKAYNLSLQRDRQQSLNILISALQKETRPLHVSEIRKAINDISHVFISDKAQQAYESGISLKKTDLNQALNKLNEALRIEPDNIAIIEDIARASIAKGDCTSVTETVLKQNKLILYDEELKLILAQSYVCQSLWIEYAKLFDVTEIRKSSLQKFWLILEVEKNIKLRNLIKAQEILLSIKKMDPKYPSYFYWSWRLAVALKKKNTEDAQKYLMSCKNISANLARQYMMDPSLCRRILEVESDLKGNNGTPE
jgi:hypothetical protein